MINPQDIYTQIKLSEFTIDSKGDLLNITPCPFDHNTIRKLYLDVDWEDLQDGDDPLFFVRCGCGAHGPYANDPVEAIRRWDRNRTGRF